MPDKTPRTKSAILQSTGQRSEQVGSAAGEARPDKHNPEPRRGPPPPEETNREPATAPGVHAAVPGAGVVGSGADAYPIESAPAEARTHGGRKAPGAEPCDAPQTAPHGRPRGTTISGVSSPPFQSGAGVVDSTDNPQATEAVTGGGAAPLNPPAPDVGRPIGDDVPGIEDPNFTAKKYSDKGSPVGSPDRRGGGGRAKRGNKRSGK